MRIDYVAWQRAVGHRAVGEAHSNTRSPRPPRKSNHSTSPSRISPVISYVQRPFTVFLGPLMHTKVAYEHPQTNRRLPSQRSQVKGPATPQGKLVSSRNSTRHGLLAEDIVLEAEHTGRFLELVESLFEEHNPRTPTQKLLVENIAAAPWRQWRIWGMQKVAFDDEVASHSTTDNPPLRAVLAWAWSCRRRTRDREIWRSRAIS
jgi:hypothetical protein